MIFGPLSVAQECGPSWMTYAIFGFFPNMNPDIPECLLKAITWYKFFQLLLNIIIGE